jgi:hypothetical protein
LAYTIHISEADQRYLDNLPISEKAKEKVFDFIDYAIANVDESYRVDPANRMGLNSAYFQRDFLLLDTDSSENNVFHRINFIIKDDAAAFGVLLIVFVDRQPV